MTPQSQPYSVKFAAPVEQLWEQPNIQNGMTNQVDTEKTDLIREMVEGS
ncbi:hypothetical protein J5X98_11920 [Leptothermofonsia sichuanensis E412]|nr:hypothetical protein [Leptothermofonsia sichuanensis]QZZ22986.1 hypothetical protein J5X98_11920 [Leptothermofonsia sichuanensis E412]